MNVKNSNRGENVCVLKIHALQADDETPTPIAIKFVQTQEPGSSLFAALLGRLRCGQKALKMAASAPREDELAPTSS